MGSSRSLLFFYQLHITVVVLLCLPISAGASLASLKNCLLREARPDYAKLVTESLLNLSPNLQRRKQIESYLFFEDGKLAFNFSRTRIEDCLDGLKEQDLHDILMSREKLEILLDLIVTGKPKKSKRFEGHPESIHNPSISLKRTIEAILTHERSGWTWRLDPVLDEKWVKKVIKIRRKEISHRRKIAKRYKGDLKGTRKLRYIRQAARRYKIRHRQCLSPKGFGQGRTWAKFAKETTVIGTGIAMSTLMALSYDKIQKARLEFSKGNSTPMKELTRYFGFELFWSTVFALTPGVTMRLNELAAPVKMFISVLFSGTVDSLYGLHYEHSWSQVNSKGKKAREISKSKDQNRLNLYREALTKEFRQNPTFRSLTQKALGSDSSGLETILDANTLSEAIKDPALLEAIETVIRQDDYKYNHGFINSGSEAADVAIYTQAWAYIPTPIRVLAYGTIMYSFCMGNTRLARAKYIAYQTAMYLAYWGLRPHAIPSDKRSKPKD